MRQFSTLLTAFVIIAAGVYFLTSSQDEGFVKIPKAKRVQAMADQDFELTKDLNTNAINRKQIRKVIENITDGAQRSTNRLNWEDRGPDNFGGRTRTLAVDPSDPSGNTIWTGGIAGGLWKMSGAFDIDYQWNKVESYNGNSAISSIVFDPSDPDIIYVGTGEGWFNADAYQGDGIYRSIDGGKSWNRLESTANLDFNYIQKLVISENRLFACTRNAGVQMSNDRGQTWQKSVGNGRFGFSDRAGDIDLASNGDLVACMGFSGTSDGIYKSTDNGDTWEELTLPGYVPYRIELDIAPSDPNVMYALKENSGSRSVEQIAKTTDGGKSWAILASPPALGMDFFSRNQGWYDLSIAIDPTDPERLIIGGVDLLLSEDGGVSWRQISQWYGANPFQEVHADQHFARFLDDTGNKIAFTNDGGVFLCADGKDSIPTIDWKNQGYNTIQFYACAVHPTDENYYIAGTQDNGTHQFTDAGTNSTTEITGGDGAFCHIDRDNPEIQISSYVYHNYWVTQNGWQSFDRFNLPNRVTSSFINPTDYDDINDILLCSGPNRKLITLDIHTGEFDSLSTNVFNTRISALKAHPNDGTIHYVGTDAGEVVRIDSLAQGSPSFTLLTKVNGNVRNIDVDVNDSNRLLFTISNQNAPNIHVSNDAGATWENQDGDLPGIPIRWAMFNPTDTASLLVASEVGIWSTDDFQGDATLWDYNNMGMTPTRVDMLDIRYSDNTLVAATHGRGLFTARLCNGLVDNDNDGYTCADDCDDFNDAINPDNAEIPYNGIDDDCNPMTLDDDIDQDGFPLDNDCDDNDPAINPDGVEIVNNGIDENCDGSDSAEECDNFASGPWNLLVDAGECFNGPVVTEWNVWSNEAYHVGQLKEDVQYYFDFCDGYDAAIFTAEVSVYYYNISTLTRGALISSGMDCRVEFGYALDVDFPEVLILLHDMENCDGTSNSAGNGYASFGCLSSGIDLDMDGFTDEYDCDDTDASINPGADEIYYNGIDNDCNDATNYNDQDNDGYEVDVDCDDLNPDINPGVQEVVFNNIDDDCDPTTLDNDIDGDGYGLDVDCDENNPDINPGAEDIVGNGIDEDCDGMDAVSSVDEGVLSHVQIYPNPTTGLVNIIIEGNYKLRIFTAQGKSIQPIINNNVLDLSTYDSGVYILSLEDITTGARKAQQVVLMK